jgi:hypothetical protein
LKIKKRNKTMFSKINYKVKLLLSISLLFFLICAEKMPTDQNNHKELLEIDDVLPNPFKGFAPWIGNENPIYDTKLQEATFAWRDLEPEEGVYDWAYLEKDWGNVDETGKLVGFRVAAAIPGEPDHIDIPEWLVNKGVEMRPYFIDNKSGLAPDWDDSTFLDAHHNFIIALGNRYDNDTRVAWIDIGSYGFWGEWHVWMNESLAGTDATKLSILEDYFEAFPEKAKVIAFDDSFALHYVVELGGGIRNDCLGTREENDWYLQSVGDLNETVWKTAIITGEFCGGEWGAIHGTNERFELNYKFIEETHWSFIGPAGGAIEPQSEQHRENLDKLHKKLGYRFLLREVNHEEEINKKDTLKITIKVENKGVAPFYFDWPMVLYLIDSEGNTALQKELNVDIREWLPGTHIVTVNLKIPDNTPVNIYNVKLAIHDPIKDKPGVMFANEGKDEQGRYLVGQLIIN